MATATFAMKDPPQRRRLLTAAKLRLFDIKDRSAHECPSNLRPLLHNSAELQAVKTMEW